MSKIDEALNVLFPCLESKRRALHLEKRLLEVERERDFERKSFIEATKLAKAAEARAVSAEAYVRQLREAWTNERARLLRVLHGASVRLADGTIGDADLLGWPDPPALALAPVKWVCSKCGSDEVEESAWVKVNSDEITGRGGSEGPSDRVWCPRCVTDSAYLVEVQRDR